MKNKNIIDIIKGRKFYLNKIEAKRINQKNEQGSVKMVQESDYEILENKDEKLSIKLNTKVFMEPETLFSIEIEHIVEYILKDSISNEEVVEAIEILLNPLGSEVSFIISAISKEMLNSRIILPPKLYLKKANK